MSSPQEKDEIRKMMQEVDKKKATNNPYFKRMEYKKKNYGNLN